MRFMFQKTDKAEENNAEIQVSRKKWISKPGVRRANGIARRNVVKHKSNKKQWGSRCKSYRGADRGKAENEEVFRVSEIV